MTTTDAPTLAEVAADDLAVLDDRLHEVFTGRSGSDLLITGGAGFLGYYLVQAPLAWNRSNPSADPITVTVHDKLPARVTDWLSQLRDPSLRLVELDVLSPLPANEPRSGARAAVLLHQRDLASMFHPLEIA